MSIVVIQCETEKGRINVAKCLINLGRRQQSIYGDRRGLENEFSYWNCIVDWGDNFSSYALPTSYKTISGQDFLNQHKWHLNKSS